MRDSRGDLRNYLMSLQDPNDWDAHKKVDNILSKVQQRKIANQVATDANIEEFEKIKEQLRRVRLAFLNYESSGKLQEYFDELKEALFK